MGKKSVSESLEDIRGQSERFESISEAVEPQHGNRNEAADQDCQSLLLSYIGRRAKNLQYDYR